MSVAICVYLYMRLCIYIYINVSLYIYVYPEIEGKEEFKTAALAIVTENDQLKYDKFFQICMVCTLKIAKCANYLHIRIEPEHELIKNYIYRTLLGEGEQTVGGAPPTPALKEPERQVNQQGRMGREQRQGKRKPQVKKTTKTST